MSGSNQDKDGSGGNDSTKPAKAEVADMPVGNSTPRPAWPVFVTAAFWFGWIVFLAYLAADVSSQS